MKYEHRIMEGRHINHTKRATYTSNADFTNANTNGLHRLPIVRVEAALKPFNLETHLPPPTDRKRADRNKGIAQKRNRLIYIMMDIRSFAKISELTESALSLR